MFYKPKFCCNCGEKVERAKWTVWNSRRFCELCETEFKGHDIVIRAIVGFGVVMGTFGLSSYFGLGRSDRYEAPTPRPVVADSAPLRLREPVSPDPRSRFPTEAAVVQPNTEDRLQRSDDLNDLLPLAENEKVRTRTEQDTPRVEKAVYHCGAKTKKGTPCSRRVKVRGARCWQHEEAVW